MEHGCVACVVVCGRKSGCVVVSCLSNERWQHPSRMNTYIQAMQGLLAEMVVDGGNEYSIV